MIERLKAWINTVLERAETLPALVPLFEIADEGIVLGALAGGLLFLLLGAALGAGNRGLLGAVIGGLSALIIGLFLGGVLGTLVPVRKGEAGVELDLDEHPGGYSEGDSVSGYIQVSATRTCRIEGGSAYLVCRGLYVHDQIDEPESQDPQFVRSSKTYYTQELPVVPAGLVRRGTPVRYPFRLPIPDVPIPTHHGFGCSVRWTLHAGLEGGPDMTNHAQEEIMVRATPIFGMGKRPERASTSSPVCELALALPRSAYAEGEALRGRVIVNPEDDFVATEMRVLLLRVEHNPKGDDHIVYINGWNTDTGRFQGESRPGGQGTTYVWLEDEVDLDEDVRFTIGEKKLYDFSFDVPEQWRPTLQTEEGDVTWRVVAVLSRPSGEDIRVHQGVTVHTSAPRIARVMATAPEMEMESSTVS